MPWDVLQTAQLTMALRLGRLCHLAYEGEVGASAFVLRREYPFLHFLPAGNGVVAGNSGEVVVALTGTRHLLDWAHNLCDCLTEGYGGRVHEGFALRAEQVWPEILAAVHVIRTREQPLRLTGHSLGGAVACLVARRLHSFGMAQATLHTFGAPRAGDLDFVEALDAEHLRFETPADPVPVLPLGHAYVPSGIRVLLTAQGRVYVADGHPVDDLILAAECLAPGRGRDPAVDHGLQVYLRRLEVACRS